MIINIVDIMTNSFHGWYHHIYVAIQLSLPCVAGVIHVKGFIDTTLLAAILTSKPTLDLSCRLLALCRLRQARRRNSGVSALKNIAPLHTELASIVAVRLQVSTVACILDLDGVLADVRQTEQSEGSGQDTQR